MGKRRPGGERAAAAWSPPARHYTARFGIIGWRWGCGGRRQEGEGNRGVVELLEGTAGRSTTRWAGEAPPPLPCK